MLNVLLILLTAPRCTRLSFSSHPYSVQLSNARVTSTLNHSYLSLVNSGTPYLSLYIFPSSFDLTSFKREVSSQLHPNFG
ncbi:hypothetical protein E2C01_102599 [Portunus trituberculatus]|uniref:Uncharacterized protein n=1 Tax=Portunus trituberculatus TaxID=210409 RepID=A0A5B7KD16_PORTR|nr:hypothetical protein [Portunus trituberculatus]